MSFVWQIHTNTHTNPYTWDILFGRYTHMCVCTRAHTHTHKPLHLGHFLWPKNTEAPRFENAFGERKISHLQPSCGICSLLPSTRRHREHSHHLWLLGHSWGKLPSEITSLGSLMGYLNRRGLVQGVLFIYCQHHCQPSLYRVATGQALGKTKEALSGCLSAHPGRWPLDDFSIHSSIPDSTKFTSPTSCSPSHAAFELIL